MDQSGGKNNPNGSTWTLRDSYGSQWIQMDPNGSTWIHMEQNGSKLIQLNPNGKDPNGSQWITMDHNGSQWIQLGPNGFLFIQTWELQQLLETLVCKHLQAISVKNLTWWLSSILSPVVETYWWTKSEMHSLGLNGWMDAACPIINFLF